MATTKLPDGREVHGIEDLKADELTKKAVLHLGMASGALFELEGDNAHAAYSAIQGAMVHGTGFVKVVTRPGFVQYLNLARIEAVDWWPEGNTL